MQQQVQRGVRVREPHHAGGGRAAVQGVPQAAMGGVQLAQDLPSHVRTRAGTYSRVPHLHAMNLDKVHLCHSSTT